MKHLLTLITFFALTSFIFGQEAIKKIRVCEAVHSEDVPFASIDQETLKNLDNTATISSENSDSEKLKITGIVYEADGSTPAKNVVLYFEQANEHGEYELVNKNGIQHLNQSAVIKTDEKGQYILNTFIPGYTKKPLTYPSTNRAKHIHMYVVENGKIAYELSPFMFDDDPALTKFCKKRLIKRGEDNLLVIQEDRDMLITEKNIRLKTTFQLVK